MQIPYIQPGQPLRRRDINAIRDGVQASLNITGSQGLRAGSDSTGVHAIPWTKKIADEKDCTLCQYLSTGSSVPFGVAEIPSAMVPTPLMLVPPVPQCRTPQFNSGLGYTHGIFRTSSFQNYSSWVQTTGIAVIMYDVTTIPAAYVPTYMTSVRLGAIPNSSYAGWDPFGPWKILVDLGQIPATTGDYYAVVEFQNVEHQGCARMLYTGVGNPDLPVGSLVWIAGNSLVPSIETEERMTCTVPDYSCRCKLGILLENASVGDYPWIRYAGYGLVLWDSATMPSSWAGCSGDSVMGHRLSNRETYGQWDENGSMIIQCWYLSGEILPLPFDTTILDGKELAQVRLDVPFTDNVLCYPINGRIDAGVQSTPPSNMSAPYRCLVFRQGEITEPNPGDIVVT